MKHPACISAALVSFALSLATVVSARVACSSKGPPVGLHVSFDLLSNHIIVVPVLIGREGPFEFLLDTGTNTTIIEPKLAESLGIHPTGRTTLETVAGSKTVFLGQVASMALGPVSSRTSQLRPVTLGAFDCR